MHYEREDLGFSFDLPDGWRRDEHNLTLTFHGPRAGLGITSELIQVQIATISPQYLSPASREQFLAEPGAQVLRSKVGDEVNVVVLRRARNSEISVVRDGIHYTIAHTHDAATEAAIEVLKQTARFPSAEMAQSAIRNWSDPRKQAVSRALRANSPEEARSILAEAGVAGARVSGGTMHKIGNRAGNSSQSGEKGCTSTVIVLVSLAVVVSWFALLR